MRSAIAAFLIAAGPVAAQAPTNGAPMSATLSFIGQEGQAVGGGTITENGGSVILRAQFSHLDPGAQGFHIHETGRCEAPDFASAGGSVTPHARADGADNPEGPHAGDMRSIDVNDSGIAILRVTIEGVTLTGGQGALLDDGGSAIVVHAGPDSDRENADAGRRVACAVVQAN